MKNKDSILMRLSKYTELTYDEQDNLLFGYLDKYCISIQKFNNICFIIIPLKLNESYTLKDINKFFGSLKNNAFIASQYIISISYNNYYISIKVKLSNHINSSCNLISNLLDTIINEVKVHKLQVCCPQCGRVADIRPYLVNKGILFRCGFCITKLKDGLLERIKHEKKNVLNNLIGALTGSILGLVILTILSLITNLNGFFAFVLAFLTIKGFEANEGKLNVKSIIFISILSTGMVALSSYLSIGISLFLNNSYPNLIDCINNIPYELGLNNYKFEFIRNLIISFVSLFAGIFVTLKIKSSKNRKEEVVQELYY